MDGRDSFKICPNGRIWARDDQIQVGWHLVLSFCSRGSRYIDIYCDILFMHFKQLIAFLMMRFIKSLLLVVSSGIWSCFSSCSSFLALEPGQSVGFWPKIWWLSTAPYSVLSLESMRERQTSLMRFISFTRGIAKTCRRRANQLKNFCFVSYSLSFV